VQFIGLIRFVSRGYCLYNTMGCNLWACAWAYERSLENPLRARAKRRLKTRSDRSEAKASKQLKSLFIYLY